MKKFLTKICIYGGVAVLSLVLLLFCVPYNKDAYIMAYNKKCYLLDNTPSPRIVFVGGSNLAFGLDSKRIEDSLHLPVLNYGLHAGIGLKFMVDDVEQYVRKGDIVIFVPEYEHFYGAACGEPQTLAPLIAYSNWAKCDLLNGHQILQVLLGIPSVIRESVMQGYSKKGYKASGFNEYGDEVLHWALPSSFISSQPIKGKFDESFGLYFVRQLDEIEQKGCKVIIIPPVIRASGFKAREVQAKTVECFLDKNGYPFLVPLTHHVLPDTCAYDTDYHMNKKGVDCFTSLLIDELK